MVSVDSIVRFHLEVNLELLTTVLLPESGLSSLLAEVLLVNTTIASPNSAPSTTPPPGHDRETPRLQH